MTQWRFFLRFVELEDNLPQERQEQLAQAGEAGMYRLPVGAPVSLLEALRGREGVWTPSDLMWRAKYLGSDYEFTEISAERAQALLVRWVELGRLDAMPSEASMITPELAAHLTGLDVQAAGQWHDVPKPPGAEDVTG